MADAPTNPRPLTRAIGLLFLVILAAGPFSMLWMPSQLLEEGDAAATARNVADSEGLLRAAMTVDVVIVLVEVAMAALLFTLLRPVSRTIALMASLARFGQAMLHAVNLLPWFAVLLLAGSAGQLGAFEPAQLDALLLAAFDVHEDGVLVGQLLFGLHLVLLGWLVGRAPYLPRLLGGLLVVGGAGYLLQSFGHVVAPGADDVLASVVVVTAAVGELPFFLYLLVRGVRRPEWDAAVGGPAGIVPPQPGLTPATARDGARR